MYGQQQYISAPNGNVQPQQCSTTLQGYSWYQNAELGMAPAMPCYEQREMWPQSVLQNNCQYEDDLVDKLIPTLVPMSNGYMANSPTHPWPGVYRESVGTVDGTYENFRQPQPAQQQDVVEDRLPPFVQSIHSPQQKIRILQNICIKSANPNLVQLRNTLSGGTSAKEQCRTVYTDLQRTELEKEFASCKGYINQRRKSELAYILGLTETRIKVWFQNRRAKGRRERIKP